MFEENQYNEGRKRASSRRGKVDKSLPWAVVLHIAYTGYGVVRSLNSCGIPVVAFQKELSKPETKSRLCERIISFSDDHDLLRKIIRFAEESARKPVLFITSDRYVKFYLNFREALEGRFSIHYPNSHVVEMLLNKDRFAKFAEQNQLTIPRSREIMNAGDLKSHLDDVAFPVIVKPYDKSERWLSAKLAKAFLVHTRKELYDLYSEIEKIEPHLLVQEWVPGPDANVEYCLTYFDGESKCLASFTGAKIRQWPVGTGSTASTKPTSNVWIQEYTIRIFETLGFKGFGSIEYKKHDVDGRYYITEPTVGRPNQQSFVATANGLNMPLIAYEALTGLTFERFSPRSRPVIYIDEWADLASAWVHLRKRETTFLGCLRLLGHRKAFRYFNRRDMRVFLYSFSINLRHAMVVFGRSVKKLLRRYWFRKKKRFPPFLPSPDSGGEGKERMGSPRTSCARISCRGS